MGRSRLSLLACLVAPAAWADYDPSQYPAYETCALCHGLYGVSHAAKFPHLGGQKPAYIEAQLHAFIAGHRTNDGGQMSAIVSELQPEDIPVVVEWFSSQTPPEPLHLEDTGAGQSAFADLGCAGCHDNSPDGAPEVPYLTAQHPGYLIKQMTDFREERRDVAAHPGMHRDLLGISDDQIAAIADYLAAQARP
jgi:cytochrome c553